MRTHALALGERGMDLYRAKLEEISAGPRTRPGRDRRWTAPDSHTRFILDWNARRLAVHDRDVEAVIPHPRPGPEGGRLA